MKKTPKAVEETKILEWKAAMEEKFQSMEKNNVWELVDLPPGLKSIKCE